MAMNRERIAPRHTTLLGLAVASLATLSHATAPAGHYTISSIRGVAVVNDTATGLVWQQSVGGMRADGGAGLSSVSDARSYCTSLGDGWRLPSVEELQTIVDERAVNPAIDVNAFPDTPLDYFWTGSSVYFSPLDPINGWWVHFGTGITGNTGGDEFITPGYVRCVR